MIYRYSMIDSFMQCPNQYYKRYILGEREEGKSSALEYGQALHLALKTHFEDGDPLQMFDLYWNSLKDVEMQYYRHSWKDLRDLAMLKFIPNFLKMHAKKFTDVKMEETIEIPFLESHTLQGTFDMASMYDGKLTISDWKTSTKEYPADKIKRNPQLYIYAALYREKYGVMPEQLMYKVFIKAEGRIQTLKINLTEKLLELQLRNVSAIVKNIESIGNAKEWYCNYTNGYCKGCLSE